MILCATDFSGSSESAMALAAWLARRFDESLLLIHVVAPAPVLVPEVAVASAEWMLNMRDVGETQIERSAEGLRRSGLRVGTRVVVGDPATAILETADEIDARFITLGTHGRKGAARLFLGSVAERVSSGARCPVVVTGEGKAEAASWPSARRLTLAVATDGSVLGLAALEWARGLSRQIPCDLTVVRVFSPWREAARYGLEDTKAGTAARAELVELIERDAREELKRLALAPDCRLRLVAASANAADDLARELALLEPDAAVLGVSHHRGTWSELSRAAVLRSSPVPVICVASDAQPALTIPQVRSVLVATDLGEPSVPALLTAYGLLGQHGGRVELCTIHERGPEGEGTEIPPRPPLDDRQRAEVEARLRALVPQAADALGIVTHPSVIEGNHASRAIVQAADRLGVDIIVMASHGRTGLKRVLLGSVAEEVARHADKPVLIVHAPQKVAHAEGDRS